MSIKSYNNFITEAISSFPTFTGKGGVDENVKAVIDEITRTKQVLNKNSMAFWNFRRFLLTLGFPLDWSRNSLRNSYFQTDNQDFYDMVIGDIPVSLKVIKSRAKLFMMSYKDWVKRSSQ